MVHIIRTSRADGVLSVEFCLTRPVYVSMITVKSTCARFQIRRIEPSSQREWALLNRSDLSTFLGQQMTFPFKNIRIEQAITALTAKVRHQIPLDREEDNISV